MMVTTMSFRSLIKCSISRRRTRSLLARPFFSGKRESWNGMSDLCGVRASVDATSSDVGLSGNVSLSAVLPKTPPQGEFRKPYHKDFVQNPRHKVRSENPSARLQGAWVRNPNPSMGARHAHGATRILPAVIGIGQHRSRTLDQVFWHQDRERDMARVPLRFRVRNVQKAP
jgi:hypothetical protein